MIKKLVFTAVLLEGGLAYGQNSSADLSVQAVPATSDPAPTSAANKGVEAHAGLAEAR